MADLFMDCTNGNDSNNGTSFALRFKTFTTGATAARTAPGDRVKLMKSADPATLGINATFTNLSPTVTLASALTKNIDTCEAAWTAVSANVTQSNPTTRKEGSKSIQFNIAAGFTTGQISYLTLGLLTDFSAYNKICFWIKPTIAIASGVLKLQLCTDNIGAAPVNTVTINEALNANQWVPITIDTGGALSALINSVSFDAISDPGTVNIQLDNIFAANNLTLTSLISLSSSATALNFYPIQSVNGTTVKLDQGSQLDASATAKGWYGTTTTATCYYLEPIPILTGQTIQEAGTNDTTRITYSGGWDTTNMTTQTGLTFLDFKGVVSILMSCAKSFISFERIVLVRGNSLGFSFDATGINMDSCACIDSGNIGFVSNSDNVRFNITNCAAYNTNSNGFSLQSSGTYSYNNTAENNGGHGFNCIGGQEFLNINSLSNNNSQAGFAQGAVSSKHSNISAKNNGTSGFITSNGASSAYIYGITTSGNGTAGITAADSSIIFVDNPACTDTTPFSASANSGRIQISRIGDDVTVARIYEGTGSTICVQIDTSTVHGSATKSFKHSPQTAHVNSTFALIQKSLPVAVPSTGTVTFTIWVQRSSTNIGAQLMIRGGQVDGIASDLTSVASAAINTWEQLSISCSPTQAGMIIIEMQTWQISGSGNAFFSDAS